ncbi:MAG: transporter permease [Aeromicrobium sp.]|nr:transporter permease [Aeromicrobium sp.]
MTWFFDNIDYIRTLTVKHIWLSVVPMVVGFVVAIPVGLYASRHRRLRGGLLSVGSILYSVPSLPLFVTLPVLLGTRILDPLNVVIALSIYAAAVMVRSASDAFQSVSPEVLDAASAAGFSGRQRFFQVQLPLAGPVLLAGLRVVSVSTVSLVSIGSLVGVSNLGTLFTDGFARDFTTEIVIGIIAIVVVALVLDGLLVLVARLLMPWSHATRVVRSTA